MNFINIYLRRKCTSYLNKEKNLHLKSTKYVTKKKIFIKKKDRETVVSNNITSNFAANAATTTNKIEPHNIKDIVVNETETITNNSKGGNKFIFENLDDNTLWNNDKNLEFPATSVKHKKIIKNDKATSNLNENQHLPFSLDKQDSADILLSKIENFDSSLHANKAPLDNENTRDSTNNETRFNELNMQMLSKKLHQQIFGESDSKQNLSNDKIMSLKRELEAFGMEVNDSVSMPDIDINLPPLEGNNLEEHFLNISTVQARPYIDIVENIIKDIPPMPEKWIFQEGWTRYANGIVEQVDYPLENGMIFDVEVCVKEGPLPTLATAVTNKAWYSWISKFLVDGNSIPVESRSFTPDLLIPIESTSREYGQKLNEYQKKPKIVIGHNVSYDRARIKEQYWLNCTGTRFVDTMALHICVSGMNSYQRALVLGSKNKSITDDWFNVTSMNNLVDVYKLYCDKKHEKSRRDVFVEGTLADVREQFHDLMNYCATDVIATHEILQKLIPLFNERFPHPVTFAGMLELSTAYLPVNTNWQRYIEASQSTFDDLNYEAKCSLAKRADEVCKLMHNDKYKDDLWMWDEDWSIQPIKMKKMTKKQMMMIDEIMKTNVKESSDFEKYLTDSEDESGPLEKEFSHLETTKYSLPARLPFMSGYPAWYRKLCIKEKDENWLAGPQNISTSMKIVPKLLNLTWENYPLHYIKEHGWGFLVPHSDDTDVDTQLPLKQLLAQCPLPKNKCNTDITMEMTTLKAEVQKDLHKTEFWRGKKYIKKNQPVTFYNGSGIWCDVDIDNCCWFFKLPHKDGGKSNVGNPLAKDFLNKFAEHVLAGLDSSATEVLQIARMMSYWRNNRDRIMSQMVIWLNENSLPFAVRRNQRREYYGAIIPQVVVSGTLTRRATEATWMTASNAHHERVGSELRAMVQAPLGYNIVGADVDSQELWIASLLGDAYCAGIHGATPFGWMTLIGTKSKGTDMHSVTAKAVGISRDHAKVINYARIYGAGQKFAERLLKQFNPSMTESEALSKSKKMFSITKGKKLFRLKSEYINDDIDDRQYSSYEAHKISQAYGKSVEQMFGAGKWFGGSESAMFNRLEEIAGNQHPVTPFLNSRLSRALETDDEDKDRYLPTKINWVVQSGAVDFLHLMLVSMRWLMRDNARFCLSFHDEIRYIVPSRYKYNAALAMHVTNLLTRSFCALRLGIKDLPMSVAFFASVEVDTILRKEASSDCKTPSNPHGLENGYEIPAGESVDILKAIDKSGGSLGSWHSAQMKKRKLENIEEIKDNECRKNSLTSETKNIL